VIAGAGFKDNVTLSHAAREESGFIRAGLDAALIRLPFDGTQVTLSLGGEDTRYLTSKSVNHEDNAFAQAEVRRFIGNWQLALGAEAGYLDEIIDVSITETNHTAVPVRGTVLAGRPGLRRDLPDGFWLSLELPGGRQYFDAPLDDYWDLGSRFTLGQAFSRKSELSLSYAFLYRTYDSQPALDLSGMAIPNVTRAAQQHDAAFALKHYWDERGRWRSITKLSFRSNSDNASGYFNYRRIQAAQQLRFQTRAWLLSGEVRLARYEFPGQSIGPPGNEPRIRSDVTFNARAERQVVKYVRIYAQFDHEQTFSNLKLDQYDVNTVSGGLMVEF